VYQVSKRCDLSIGTSLVRARAATWRSRTVARRRRGKVWRRRGCGFGTRRGGLLHKHGTGSPMARLRWVHRRCSRSSAAHGISEGLSRRGSPFGLEEGKVGPWRGEAGRLRLCRAELLHRRRRTSAGAVSRYGGNISSAWHSLPPRRAAGAAAAPVLLLPPRLGDVQAAAAALLFSSFLPCRSFFLPCFSFFPLGSLSLCSWCGGAQGKSKPGL